MNEEYLQSLYDYISSNDATYKDDVSFDDFKISMGDRKYASNMYGYITDLDPTYKQDIGIKDFLDVQPVTFSLNDIVVSPKSL